MKLIHNILSPSGRPRVIHPSGQQPVHFVYDPVGNNIRVRSSVANDWERNYTYDWLGRRLSYTEGELAESLTYDGANTRSYKLSMLNQNQWTNGQPEPIHLQLQSAMFYPNAYINFNQNGEYTIMDPKNWTAVVNKKNVFLQHEK